MLNKIRLRQTASVLLALAGMAGCGDDPPSSGALPGGTGDVEGTTPTAVSEGTRTQLRNAEYRGIFDESVRLIDGRYTGPTLVPGSASRPELTLMSDQAAIGDLDGDGEEEVVTLLAHSEGGSGTFLHLAVMREAGNQLINVETVLLGDRVQVSSLEIQGRSLVGVLLEHGPDDPACCPTQRAWRVWELQDARLRDVVVFRGHLVYGHEAHEFTSCDEGERYWVLDGTEGDLPQIYRALATGPYDPVFVQVRALLIPEGGSGFGEDYQAQIRVTDLFRAAREGPGCEEDLRGIDFRALGVEPFWTLDVKPDGLEFRGLDFPARRFDIEATSQSAGLVVWSASAEDGTALKVEIRDRRCVDPMSGSVFPLQAEVTVDGAAMSGCATRGNLL